MVKRYLCLWVAILLIFSMIAVAACKPIAPNDPVQPIDPDSTVLSRLTATNGKVTNADGKEVLLRGTNVGGLFVTEHWMTGFVYGGSPSNDYRSLTQTFIKRFGEEQTKALWAEYRSDWWQEVDLKICADMGFNVLRLPFTYMNVDFAAVTDYEKAGKQYDFSDLDNFVNTAAKYGMYTILDLHGAYGSQNGQDHSGQIIDNVSDVDFYSNEQMMSLTIKLWGALAAHFKGNTNVAGYDILNEPGEKAGVTTERHWNFYNRVYKAIREEGDEHIVIFESCWDAANLPRVELYGWTNCMYSFHHYAGDKLSYTDYCNSWNYKLSSVASKNFGVPLFMGEFTNYKFYDNWRYTLNLLNKSDWHWTTWTYKVWGNSAWGVVNVRGSGDDKVRADTDSYEDIIKKFGYLRTEFCQKYTFSNGITLENLLIEFAKTSED